MNKPTVSPADKLLDVAHILSCPKCHGNGWYWISFEELDGVTTTSQTCQCRPYRELALARRVLWAEGEVEQLRATIIQLTDRITILNGELRALENQRIGLAKENEELLAELARKKDIRICDHD